MTRYVLKILKLNQIFLQADDPKVIYCQSLVSKIDILFFQNKV